MSCRTGRRRQELGVSGKMKLPARAAEKPRKKWTFADEMAAGSVGGHDALQQAELLCADWGGVREDIYSNFFPLRFLVVTVHYIS
jgi:hypothetical protein